MRRIHLEFSIPEIDEKNVVGNLFKEYVGYQHQGNSFTISEHKLTMEVVFDDMPEMIISAIANLPYFNISSMEVTEEDEQKQEESEEEPEVTQVEGNGIGEEDSSVEEVSHEVGEKSTGESRGQEKEETSEKTNHSREVAEEIKKKRVRRKSRNPKRRIPEADGVAYKAIHEMVDKSDSFEEFIGLVGDFIDVGEYCRKFFNALIMSASDAENQTSDAIFSNMEKYGEAFSVSKRITISQKVKNAFERIGSESRMMAVVAAVARFKDFPFEKDTEFFILGKEIVDAIIERKKENSSIQFVDKVAIVLDMIRSDSHIEEYKEMRDNLIEFVTKVVNMSSSGIGLKVAFKKNMEPIFGEKAHKGKALLFQSIKEYCEKRGIDSDAKYDCFFQELSFLM